MTKTRKYINLNNIFAGLNKHDLGDVQTRGQFLSKKEQSAWVKTKKNITKHRKITYKNKKDTNYSAEVQEESKSVMVKTTIISNVGLILF